MTSILGHSPPSTASAASMDIEARWRGLVDKVLKGADFERRLAGWLASVPEAAP